MLTVQRGATPRSGEHDCDVTLDVAVPKTSAVPKRSAVPNTTGVPLRARLLVVDDERNLVELLCAAMRYEGFEVATARSGHEALHVVKEFEPDLILLDVMMPGLDGFEVVKRWRGQGTSTPVLFLTAKDASEDKVAELTAGGGDYVTKPFSLEEVVARVRTVLRRSKNPGARGETARLRFGDLELDEDAHQVFEAGVKIALSPTELNVLRFFLLNPGRVLSKGQMLDHVWHDDFGGDVSVVESYVSYLRRKIDTTDPRLLHTIRGVGCVPRISS